MYCAWLILLSLSVIGSAEYTDYCPLLGPVFPPPKLQPGSSTFTRAKHDISKAFGNASEALSNSGINLNNTSLSLQVFSAGDSDLFHFSHTAPSIRNATKGVREVDQDTVFRIGSCSKVWTMLLLLIEMGDAVLRDPVVKYIPELRYASEELRHNAAARANGVNTVDWDEVTIGELASHLAGITRDYGIMDLAFKPAKMETLGFPPLPETEVPPCGPLQACNRSAFLDGMLKSHPVVPTASTPVYSNAAFQLLGYAMEEMTNKTYQELLQDDLVNPLDLARSSYSAPRDEHGIIPDGGAMFWNLDLGDETPAGGLYSSARDMATFGRAILNSTLLSPAVTRRWMKPAAHTSKMENFVGAPWEILSVSHPRVMDLYTKAGGIGPYSTKFALSPDHDAGFIVLAAGDNAVPVSVEVSNLVVDALIPALELAAKEEAARLFSGTYALENGKNSSITLSTDDGPGLKVVEWVSDSKDMFEAISVLFALGDPSQASVRLYPTGLESSGKISFRAIMQSPSQFPAQKGPFDLSCMTWVMVDSKKYGNVGVDEFLFDLDSHGGAAAVSPRALREWLPRVDVNC